MIKTEHILYINSNTRYNCSKGDGAEFEIANETLAKHTLSPFREMEEETYLADYISGMYPEFEKAFDFFHEEFYKYPDSNKNDALMSAKAKVTMNKFGLKKEYDFDCEPNKEQLRRINERIKPKMKTETAKYVSGFLKDMASVLLDTCDDYRQAYQFLRKTKIIAGIVSGKYAENVVCERQDKVDGAKEGLAFLSLKKQGLIDDNLQITDIDKFCDSEIIKEFAIGGKTYNIADGLRKLYGRPVKNVSRYQQPNNTVRQA